jgi:hypothetical protein
MKLGGFSKTMTVGWRVSNIVDIDNVKPEFVSCSLPMHELSIGDLCSSADTIIDCNNYSDNFLVNFRVGEWLELAKPHSSEILRFRDLNDRVTDTCCISRPCALYSSCPFYMALPLVLFRMCLVRRPLADPDALSSASPLDIRHASNVGCLYVRRPTSVSYAESRTICMSVEEEKPHSSTRTTLSDCMGVQGLLASG